MTTRPDVSILIPVHNREKLVLDALESALCQTHGNIEIVVVDNASTDGTYDAVRTMAGRDARVTVYRNEANLGPVLNWKHCIDLAAADIVKIVFSDDWIDPRYVERTLPMLAANGDTGFVFTPVKIHCGGNERTEHASLGKTGLYAMSLFVEDHLFGGERFPVSPGCALFRKRDLEKNLLIDIPNEAGLDFRNYGAGNDLLLFLLCFPEYARFGFVFEPLSHFRSHDGCISASPAVVPRYLLAKRHFVDTAARREYRDNYYSYLYLRSLSRGAPYGELLKGASYRKAWGFMALSLLNGYRRKLARHLGPEKTS